MFISIDGGDGTGKSTQVGLLRDWLIGQGRGVVVCRDPGSTPLGEAIRELLLKRSDLHLHLRSEMLLYMAARAQLAEEVIRPALQKGKLVLSDRYLLANVVYQGYGGGLDVEILWEIGRVAVGGIMPDLTVVLDLPVEEAAKRNCPLWDRMESRSLDFHRRVREGFLTEASRNPQQILVVDARGSINKVHQQIRRILASKIEGS